MFTRRVCAQILIPAAVVVKDASKKEDDPNLIRPSELPIYTRDSDKQSKKPEHEVVELPPPNVIENFFATIRHGVTSATKEVSALKTKTTDIVTETQQNFDWLVKYLQEEDNSNAKYGAIAIGGLTGYILGLRGGFFRRSIFATAGAVGMASLCYPKEAAQYSELAIEEGRRYANIGYNFAYGVTKDDPPLELPSLPKIPTSLSEAWDAAAGVGKSVTSLFSDGTDSEEKKK